MPKLVEDPNFCISADDDITTQFAKFAIERHKIYLKRYVQKQDKPWTQDPILRSYRFCNIYRELDTVSIWIRKNIIKRYETNPNLWFMLCVARIINWPPTLQMLMDKGLWPEQKWEADRVYKALKDYYSAGNKVITSAYLINSVFPKDMNPPDKRKVYYIPKVGLDPMWQDRSKIAKSFKVSLEAAADTIRNYRGWANFMSYQVVVDLSYSDLWLAKARDYNTFNLAGPGTQRGLNRYFTGDKKATLPKKDLTEHLIQQRKEINSRMKELVPRKWWTNDFSTGFAKLSLSNVSNLNCETDKYLRVFYGEGDMRALYPGAPK